MKNGFWILNLIQIFRSGFKHEKKKKYLTTYFNHKFK